MQHILTWLNPVVEFLTSGSWPYAMLFGLIFGWALTPGVMYLLALIEGKRRFRMEDEFHGFMPGDIFLGTAFSIGCGLFAQACDAGYAMPGWWRWVPFAVSVVAVVGLTVPEIVGTCKYREGDTNRYHPRQMVSPRKIWHNVVVYGFYGYLQMAICVPGILLGNSFIVDNLCGRDQTADILPGIAFDVFRIVMLISLGKWVSGMVYDSSHPKFSTAHTKVNLGQWLAGMLMIALALMGLWAIV